jgi:hypothetical protein
MAFAVISTEKTALDRNLASTGSVSNNSSSLVSALRSTPFLTPTYNSASVRHETRSVVRTAVSYASALGSPRR